VTCSNFRAQRSDRSLQAIAEGIVTIVIWSPSPQGQVSKYDRAGITSINVIATGTLGDIPIEC